jgi:hypothetical protein
VVAFAHKGRIAMAEARARNDALAFRLDVGSYPTLMVRGGTGNQGSEFRAQDSGLRV